MHKKLVNPSIFICFNRWDCIDEADVDKAQIDGVKRQHLDSAFNLLVQELGLTGSMDGDKTVQDRIFLLSAKEAVAHRTNLGQPKERTAQQLLRYTCVLCHAPHPHPHPHSGDFGLFP